METNKTTESDIQKSYIASIDIGRKNFAWIVLDKTYMTMGHEVISLSEDHFDLTALDKLFEELHKNITLWKMCKFLLIESQFFQSIGHKRLQANIECIKIQEATMSWFRLMLPDVKIIVIQPKEKTRYMVENIPELITKKLTYYQRKSYSVKLSKTILETIKDNKGLAFLVSLKKKDDIADCYLQVFSHFKVVLDMEVVKLRFPKSLTVEK